MGRTGRYRKKKKLLVLAESNSIKLGHDSTLVNLMSWLKGHKWKPSCSLHPTYFPFTGRGLMAGRNIVKNEILVEIPLTALVTSKTVDESDVGNILAEKALLCQEILAAFLIMERRKDHESQWCSYISSLPKEFSTPLFLSSEALKFLPNFVKQPIKEMRKKAFQSFARLQELLLNLGEDEFQWAWTCVNTRAVYLPKPFAMKETSKLCIIDHDCLALAPFLDLFNHSNDVSVEVKVTSDGYALLTHTPYKKHDQVFISYGPHSNLKLFLEYGFAIPCNPHDALPLSEKELLYTVNISESNKSVRDKISFLKSQGIMNSAAFNRDGITWSALAAIRLLKCKNFDPHEWPGVLYCESGDEVDKISVKSLTNTAKNLEQHISKCCQRLAKYLFKKPNSATSACCLLLTEFEDIARLARLKLNL